MTTTTLLDDKIKAVRQELTDVRRARWDAEKDFYEQTEEKRCGISILRSRMYELLNQGVDFQVFHDAMAEANNHKDDPVPYISMHFGLQVVLLSTIHQMELRKNVLKETAKSGKKMVLFLEEKKEIIEQETAALAVESVEKIGDCDRYVIDEALAQKVVAQRLVIRKLRSNDDCISNNSEHSTVSSSGGDYSTASHERLRMTHVPVEELEDIDMGEEDEDANELSSSPRDVKSIVAPELSPYDNDDDISSSSKLEPPMNDNLVLQYLQTGVSSASNWGSLFRNNNNASATAC
mmetsp:Transcript_2498/g.3967  ORF Transcript_2498/g.3967 Transcript_2498/m.3967 type:complete len:292 (+) Transcript_2498:86-961(+)